jgi:hypothetical protein
MRVCKSFHQRAWNLIRIASEIDDDLAQALGIRSHETDRWRNRNLDRQPLLSRLAVRMSSMTPQ